LLAGEEPERDKEGEEGSSDQDLMREHGVLKRVPSDLWRKHSPHRDEKGLPPEAIADATGTICNFIGDYHEKLEEMSSFRALRRPMCWLILGAYCASSVKLATVSRTSR